MSRKDSGVTPWDCSMLRTRVTVAAIAALRFGNRGLASSLILASLAKFF
jgi:hypothetical protein